MTPSLPGVRARRRGGAQVPLHGGGRTTRASGASPPAAPTSATTRAATRASSRSSCSSPTSRPSSSCPCCRRARCWGSSRPPTSREGSATTTCSCFPPSRGRPAPSCADGRSSIASGGTPPAWSGSPPWPGRWRRPGAASKLVDLATARIQRDLGFTRVSFHSSDVDGARAPGGGGRQRRASRPGRRPASGGAGPCAAPPPFPVPPTPPPPSSRCPCGRGTSCSACST